jgi:class 3 adenylate cyclase
VESNHRPYNYLASIGRIDEYLAQSPGNYQEVDELPDRSSLTYTNGFYAQWCSAMFVDIRDSSKLPDVYTRPVLAKIYRAYISEVVAIMSGVPKVHEINIVGDGVWAVFNARNMEDADAIFSAACQVNSLVDILNYKMAKADYSTPIRVGVGIADGRALMVKAGFSGSGINDVVYMGQVVNRAAKLASEGSKGAVPPIVIDADLAVHLDAGNQELITYDAYRRFYTSSAINVLMDDWLGEQAD